jgi:hypothetical protein
MANPVTVQDVENRWRPLSTDQAVVAQALLDDVWALAKREIPTLDASITAETIDIAIVRQVLCAAVLRVLKNPDGRTQEALDDYSYTLGSGADGTLHLTEDDLVKLRPAPTDATGTSGAFSIHLAYEADTTL